VKHPRPKVIFGWLFDVEQYGDFWLMITCRYLRAGMLVLWGFVVIEAGGRCSLLRTRTRHHEGGAAGEANAVTC
jgi:hypothetical protein